MLKIFRIIAAIAVLTLSLIFFLDFTGTAPLWLHGIMKAQLVPALLSRSWLLAAALLLSVLLFGRLYCSVLCPFGLLQDAIGRIKRFVVGLLPKEKKQTGAARRNYYKPPHNIVRYGFFLLAALPFFFGITVGLTLLDPYSNFGRIAVELFSPVYVWCNNLLTSIFNHFGNYAFYSTTRYVSLPAALFAGGVLVAVTVMVIGRGRLWCNTVCPVGTLMGFISRFSILRVSMGGGCTHCNKCAAVCKSECIDHKNLKIDGDRCVACYNCLNECKFDAINYKFAGFSKKAAACTENSKKTVSPGNKTLSRDDYDPSRRRFITGAAAALAVMPIVAVASDYAREILRTRKFPLPPGASDDFSTRCTGCQLCVSKCPMNLLRPAFFERGLKGVMQPYMYFQPHCYCNYDCIICCSVCPTGALTPLTVEEKKVRQVGVVNFIMESCVVYRDNVDCGACAEHCPTQAVAMVPYKDGLRIPQTDQAICIGCGACESICPERPNAIFVEGLEHQEIAEKPEEEAK